jgi:ribosomal protein L9
LNLAPVGGHSFLASVAGEPLVITVDPDGADELAGELVPGAESAAAGVVLEYMMRRLFFTLVTSWTGPETVGASFEGAAGSSAPQSSASVRLGVSVNTTPFTVWFGLGAKMVETLDGLWRRQVQSTAARAATGSVQARIEVAQLGVPPQMLAEYLKVGAKGKSFGSVTAKDVEASLKALGYEVDRRQIRVIDAIRGPGAHKVEVKLHSEVVVPVQVKVIAAQVAAPAAAEGEESGKKRKSRKKAESAEGGEEAAAEGTDQEAAPADSEAAE